MWKSQHVELWLWQQRGYCNHSVSMICSLHTHTHTCTENSYYSHFQKQLIFYHHFSPFSRNCWAHTNSHPGKSPLVVSSIIPPQYSHGSSRDTNLNSCICTKHKKFSALHPLSTISIPPYFNITGYQYHYFNITTSISSLDISSSISLDKSLHCPHSLHNIKLHIATANKAAATSKQKQSFCEGEPDSEPLDLTAHLFWRGQRLYSECVCTNIHDLTQLVAICGVWAPHFLSTVHKAGSLGSCCREDLLICGSDTAGAWTDLEWGTGSTRKQGNPTNCRRLSGGWDFEARVN